MYEKILRKVHLDCYVCGLSFDKENICNDCQNHPKNGDGAFNFECLHDIASDVTKKRVLEKIPVLTIRKKTFHA